MRSARAVARWVLWWAVLMTFWLILDHTVARDELLTGAGAAALGAFLAATAVGQADAAPLIRLRWLQPLVRLPAEVAHDLVIIFAALWRKLARGEEPASGYRRVQARSGGDAGEMTRQSLLIGIASVAPNSFVAGFDAERDEMVIHQLVATRGEAVH